MYNFNFVEFYLYGGILNKICKDIIKNIFSVTNVKYNNSVWKQIKFFGFEFKFKNKYKTLLLQKRVEYRKIKDITSEKKFKNMKSALNFQNKLKYKAKFLLFRYDYLFSLNEWGVNLGDYVQTLAVKYVINTIFRNIKFEFCDRDNLSNYSGEPVFTIMQGWFSHSNYYLPNENILPIFVGTHITTSKREQFIGFVASNYEYFKNITFGCRDISTLVFLKDLGLKSYLSRCLTLTFPKREEKNTQNKVYIVDIPDDICVFIPQDIKENAIYKHQRSVDINKPSSFYMNSERKYIKQTEELLHEYRDNAKLVITSALHCASPCIAMGIPTILIDFEENNDRFGSLSGIYNIYTKNDLINGTIDYNPASANIEELKQLMIKNVELSIKQAFDEDVDVEELNVIRDKIQNFHA